MTLARGVSYPRASVSSLSAMRGLVVVGAGVRVLRDYVRVGLVDVLFLRGRLVQVDECELLSEALLRELLARRGRGRRAA